MTSGSVPLNGFEDYVAYYREYGSGNPEGEIDYNYGSGSHYGPPRAGPAGNLPEAGGYFSDNQGYFPQHEFNDQRYSYSQLYPNDVFNALPLFDKHEFSDYSQTPFKRIFDFDKKYPSWSEDSLAPLTEETIWSIFESLQRQFGFQKDSCANMFDHFMLQLDSRASRFSASEALLSLHSDYIGGQNSNYRKWYFAANLDLDDEIATRTSSSPPERLTEEEIHQLTHLKPQGNNLSTAIYHWKLKMSKLSPEELVTQVALYLLIWGESNQVRFLPECICYIYKCASDYLLLTKQSKDSACFGECDFLDRVITPIYNFIRDQQFEKLDGKYLRREKDHSSIIGYDDMNQLFWYPEGLSRIITEDGVKLSKVNKAERYLMLGEVAWKKVFYKTYYESRTWFHLITNFSRIWVIHFAVFWYCTSFNSTSLYTPNYHQTLDNQPTPQAVWSVTALAGTISSLVYLVAIIGEMCFIPKRWPGRQYCIRRFFFGLFLLSVNFLPSIYVFVIIPIDVYSFSAYVVSIVQFCISIITVVFLSFQPLGRLFVWGKKKRYASSQTFTASFPKLSVSGRTCSLLLWCSVFLAKFLESYMFLTLSLKDPVRNLSTMIMDRCIGDAVIGPFLCRQQGRMVLALMFVTDLVLFFLDTYLWYIICNCFFSVILSFSSGMSIFSPWRNCFSRLPQRIGVKILSEAFAEGRYKNKFLVSQVWNSIIISMFQEHILSKEQAASLLYKQFGDEVDNLMKIREPLFFVNQDQGTKESFSYFSSGSEADRRISFFAHSLSTLIPDPVSVDAMPVFTVLIPHYSEKILLSLKDTIREDVESKMSILEYLRQLHGEEWTNFVEDSKELNSMELEGKLTSEEDLITTPFIISEKVEVHDVQQPLSGHINIEETKKLNSLLVDIPFYCVGFKSSSPNKILRTRVWASLRTQTLFRTIAGFNKYFEAIKLLYRTENLHLFDNRYEDLETDAILNYVARRKVHLVVSMQRYCHFSDEEYEAVKVMMTKFPFVKIVMLLKQDPVLEGEDPVYFSCLLGVKEGESIDIPGQAAPNLEVIYKIKLSGNPIIGDGKSDNQNHALIFYRGEYIQVIDANQDMYLEECLKIRSVLAEFEEMECSDLHYNYDPLYTEPDNYPVAVVGAREHIFTEQLGVLADVAAGKEKTFGTLFARTLAEIGGKLHYGHPDFLNAIFMTTRGGISKAQKGIHLNEDIYAGITATCRGGRIKHSDYFQCGKGRDIGFDSILNFTSKIGGGMGEQMLSREYFYLGTQLPLHRFLSFYYAHPGFHINNLFIILSIELFMMVMMNMGALNHEVTTCIYNKNVPFTDLQRPLGCYNLQPVLDWVNRFVVSICICFLISFAPLLVQEFTERGFSRAIFRFLSHFLSLSPIFEVFVCKIYSNSLKNDLTFGNARYIATGRGMATSRASFTDIYSRYAGSSIYSGIRLTLILLFATLTMWQVGVLWFWLTIGSLCFSPFIFNPHQFAMFDYFLDYRNFLKWLNRGNLRFDANSWISYTRASRSKFTGLKKRTWKNEDLLPLIHRAAFANCFFSEICLPFSQALCAFIAYMFINSQTGVKESVSLNLLIRMVILVVAPIIINCVALLVLFPVSCVSGTIFKICSIKLGNFFAAMAHTFGLIVHVVFFEITFFLEGFNISRSLSCIISTIYFQRLIFQVIKTLFLTRELKEDYANRAWWSGRWIRRGVGTLPLTQPIRELSVKTVEMSLFAADFICGHLLFFAMTPLVFIPYVDRLHSWMLFWLRPGVIQYKRGITSIKLRNLRKRRFIRWLILYIFMMMLFLILLLVPILSGIYCPDLRDKFPVLVQTFIQPMHQQNNDTGTNAPSFLVTKKPNFVPYKTHPY